MKLFLVTFLLLVSYAFAEDQKPISNEIAVVKASAKASDLEIFDLNKVVDVSVQRTDRIEVIMSVEENLSKKQICDYSFWFTLSGREAECCEDAPCVCTERACSVPNE